MYLWRAGHRLRLFSSSYERQKEILWENYDKIEHFDRPGDNYTWWRRMFYERDTPLLHRRRTKKVSWYCDNLERRRMDEQTRQRRPKEGNSKIPRNIEDMVPKRFLYKRNNFNGLCPINDHLEYAIRTRFLRVSIAATYSSGVHSRSVRRI